MFLIEVGKNILIAFFDIDGVLSVPRYDVGNGVLKPGGTQDWWIEFNMDRNNTYDTCRAPITMVNFVKELRKRDIIIKCITEEHSSFALNNKAVWVEKQYGIPFEDIFWVDNKDAKVPMILKYCKMFNYLPNEVLFVEDTFPTVLQATTERICAVHISEFIV